MGSVIAGKNKFLLKEGQNQPTPCDCNEGQCPVDGNCKKKGVIYEAKLRTQDQEEHSYIGLTEKKFSERYFKHLSSFEVQDPRNSTSFNK